MLNISFVVLGVVVLVFVLCVALFIFAPKSLNYFDAASYPILLSIKTHSLDIFKSDLDAIKEPPPKRKPRRSRQKSKPDTESETKSDESKPDTESETKSDAVIQNDKKGNPPWVKWIDTQNIVGDIKVYPLRMFETSSISRQILCDNTYRLLQIIPDAKSYAFIKIGAKSQINKHTEWKDNANNTLRALFVLSAPFITSPEQCSVWVNGEIKELKPNSLIIFDSSKEHSIYNNSRKDIYALMIDMTRPKKISRGTSVREYNINDNTAINEFKNQLTNQH
jgi:hypothetical protein